MLIFCAGPWAAAETLHVSVGDTGCTGRQVAVQRCWSKITGVSSVTVLPRNPVQPAAQRTFVIVTTAATPSADTLRRALGRKAKNYPIKAYQNLSTASEAHKDKS